MTATQTSATHTSMSSAGGGGDWVSTLARAGLVAKGAIYVVIGLLAINLAVTGASQDTTTTGAIEAVARQPFGQVLLALLTAGLLALAAWRAVDAFRGDPVEGTEAKDRARYGLKALLYLSAASSALGILLANWGKSLPTGGGNGGGDDTAAAQRAAATILDWPFGQWLVAIGGAAVIGFGLYTIYSKVMEAEFTDWLKRSMDGSTRNTVVRAGQAGYAARAVTFVIIGIFLIQAAVTYSAQEAVGVSGALRQLADSWWGQLLLYVVAAGLLMFGLFNLALARYRRVA